MFDLENITDPSFVKKLSIKELKILAKEIREFLIDNISNTGGHLSSNLGVVEITIALYYVFDPEKDKILFDVGHQSYVHKILTGRAKEFKTLRKYGGLSGYINKTESKYDVWESGHSSTSISAMGGMLKVSKDKNERIVTLIGDASIMNGIALEGLNYLGETKDNRAIVILNDNKMGISKSVGALSKTFAKMRGSWIVKASKSFCVKIFPKFIVRLFHKFKRSLKGLIQIDNIFEDLGFDYYGPYDGHNIKALIRTLENVKKYPDQPILIHINTTKGKGYDLSEKDEFGDYHGVSPFDKETGKPKCEYKGISYSKVVSEFLEKRLEKEEFLMITPAMISGSKLGIIKNNYSDKIVDVGIAEEHAALMSAGIALSGKKTVLFFYSTFAQRAFDELLNDISRQNLDVIIGIDRAGIVGEDGSTHQGLYDVAMFSMMPNVIITMPRNVKELIGIFNYAFCIKGPIVIRYPRLREEIDNLDFDYITTLDWEILNEGNAINLIGYGADIERINKIVKENNISANVIDAKCIKPMDTKMLNKIFNNNLPIIVFEQVVSSGTLYHKILEFKENNNYNSKIIKHSFDSETIIPHGSIKEVYEHYGLSDLELKEFILNNIK